MQYYLHYYAHGTVVLSSYKYMKREYTTKYSISASIGLDKPNVITVSQNLIA